MRIRIEYEEGGRGWKLLLALGSFIVYESDKLFCEMPRNELNVTR